MIKKSVFENELIAGMERQLVLSAEADGINSLEQAVEYIHSAIETFEEAGMTAQADALLKVLSKIAIKHKSKKKIDKTTKGLTSDKMVENLLNHGTEFNLLDDNMNDLLEADIAQPESFENDYAKWLRMKPVPKPKCSEIDPDLVGLVECEDDDLLEADIGDENFEVSEMQNRPEMDFEDEI